MSSPRAPFNSPQVGARTPTPPAAPLLLLPEQMQMERPPHGWLHSSAAPDVSVCDNCGAFEENSLLEKRAGCCSYECWIDIVQKGIRMQPCFPADLSPCRSCSKYFRTSQSADGYHCSSDCSESCPPFSACITQQPTAATKAEWDTFVSYNPSSRAVSPLVGDRTRPALARIITRSPAIEEEMRQLQKKKE